MRRDSRGSVRKTTLELRAKIIELAFQGHSDKEIAEIVERSVATVRQTTRWIPQPGDDE